MKKNWLKVLAAFVTVMLLMLLALVGYVDYNQKKILKDLITQLNKNVRGKLNIEKISLTIFSEFPNLSVTLDNGVIKDSLNQHEIFRAGKIYCRINPFNLLFKKVDVRSVIIQDANIFLQQDSLGLNAQNIFIQSKDTTSSAPINITFNINQLKLQNLHLSFNDDVRKKHISVTATDMMGKINHSDPIYQINLHGWLHTDSMLFKADKGNFLFNRDMWANLNLTFNTRLQRLDILPSPVLADQQQYKLEGNFAFAQKPATLRLLITDSTVNFSKAKLLLSSMILKRMKNIEVLDPVNVRVLIEGPILPDAPPQVDANFTLINGHIQYYGVNLTNVNMHGLFMNHVKAGIKNDDPNSELVFDFNQAKVNGVDCVAKVSVVDLVALHTELSAALNASLVTLNQSIGADTVNYKFNSGNAAANIHYKGTIYYYMDTIKSNFDDTLAGTVTMTNGVFNYLPRNIELSNMQTDIAFSQNQVDFKNISCAINGNPVTLSGSVTSVRRIVSGEVEKMIGSLKVNAPRFDLNKILAVKNMSKPEVVAKASAPAAPGKITALIDTITNMLSVNLAIKCDEFIFRRLSAQNVTASVDASSAGFDIKDFKLNTCQGNVNINGSLITVKDHSHVNATANINNINIKQFLYGLQNFDQTTIKDDNLTGVLNAQVNFSSPLKSDYNIVPDSMAGRVHFSLTNGSLINFEPIASVGKWVFRNRDFKHVTFAEIKDTVYLHNNTFFLHKMEIATSVMRLFMQGRFSFTGACDLAIQVPLNNLRRQDINYQPENIGVDAKAGPSIFLRVLSDKNNKVKITLDPAAKQRMKKGVSAQPIPKKQASI